VRGFMAAIFVSPRSNVAGCDFTLLDQVSPMTRARANSPLRVCDKVPEKSPIRVERNLRNRPWIPGLFLRILFVLRPQEERRAVEFTAVGRHERRQLTRTERPHVGPELAHGL